MEVTDDDGHVSDPDSEPDDSTSSQMSKAWDALENIREARVLKTIPLAIRGVYTEIMKSVLSRLCVDPTDTDLWRILLYFPLLFLQLPGRGGVAGRRNYLHRFQLYRDRNILALVDQAVRPPTTTPPATAKGRPMTQVERDRRSAIFLGKRGEFSRSIRRAMSAGTPKPSVDQSKEIHASLASKHPVSSTEFTDEDFTIDASDGDGAGVEAPQLDLTMASLASALQTSPRGAAAGLSGWTPELLLPLLGDSEAMDLFLYVVLMIVHGGLPTPLRRGFSAARLIPIIKCASPLDVRPIAIGDGVRRLVSRAICNQLRPNMSRHFLPLQMGVAEPMGLETIIHSVQLMTYTAGREVPNVVVTLDTSNAFNAVLRKAIIAALRESFPALLPYFETVYRTPAELFYHLSGVDKDSPGKWEKILSSEGTQQGDPLGPFFFCLALHTVLVTVLSDLGEQFKDLKVLLRAYIDDLTLAGPIDQVARAVALLIPRLSEIGLHLNNRKCRIFMNGLTDVRLVSTLEQGILSNFTVCHDGITVLGAPVGKDAFVMKACEDVLLEVKSKFSAITSLGNAQIGHALCRLCCIPTLTFLMRTVEPRLMLNVAKSCDQLVLAYMQGLLHREPVQGNPYVQATLPIRLGGLGLRLPSTIVCPAYLGSWCACWSSVFGDWPVLKHVNTLQQKWGLEIGIIPYLSAVDAAFMSLANIPVPADATLTAPSMETGDGSGQAVYDYTNLKKLLVAGRNSKVQQHFTRRSESWTHAQLLGGMDAMGRTRLLSCSGIGASGWLTAIPFCGSLTLSNEEFCTAALLRLGLPIPACVSAGSCVCGKPMDDLGRHALVCSKAGWLQRRHDNLRDTFVDILKSAGLSTKIEVIGLFGENSERADILVHRYVDGRPLLLDITVTTPHTSVENTGASDGQGHSARSREQQKDKKYRLSARNNGYLFEPLAFETFGLIGKQAWGVLEQTAKIAGSEVSLRQGVPFPTFVHSFLHHAAQRLSVCLQKFNAQMICRKSTVAPASSGRRPGAGSSISAHGVVFNPHLIRDYGAAGWSRLAGD